MSFFEEIAAALDAEGIESRVHDGTMFVPITAELEIQFVEIDPILPAANVYIAVADVDEDDDEFDAVLVSVVFSVDDALAAVARHVATDQMVTLLSDLLLGTDERIADLDFYQSTADPNLVTALVGDNSELRVLVEIEDETPKAHVTFVAIDSSFDDIIDDAIAEVWDADDEMNLSDEDRARLFEALNADVAEVASETLELGSFTDFDRLFDVLSLASDQAESWEEQLTAIDEDEFVPDVYDIFAEDIDDEEFGSLLGGTDDEADSEDEDEVFDLAAEDLEDEDDEDGEPGPLVR